MLAPFARKSQSELAIYGASFVRRTSRNSLSKCTQIRSSSDDEQSRARDLLFGLALLPRLPAFFAQPPTTITRNERYFYGLHITLRITAIPQTESRRIELTTREIRSVKIMFLKIPFLVCAWHVYIHVLL